MWVRAGLISDYVYEVDLYTGKKPNVEVKVQKPTRVPLHLPIQHTT